MTVPSGSPGADVARPSQAPTRVRRIILFILILHYANTYMDRVVIAAAAPVLKVEFALDQVTLGIVFSAFSLSYALFQTPGGWLADRFGPRRVLTGIVCWWSTFTMATAAAWNAGSLVVLRFLFGSGEAGAFPSATRAFSRWLPASERGFAQGITHSGARLAAAVTPPLAAFMILTWGWRVPFVVFGTLGFVWAAVWYRYYRDRPSDHPQINEAELAIIRAGAGTLDHAGGSGKVPWRTLLASRNMWTICLMYFCYLYAFWIYLTWLPTYLVETRGFTLLGGGVVAGLPLLAGSITNTVGGWLSDRLSARRGLRFGRRSVAIAGFLVALLAIVPGALVANRVAAIVLLTLAAAGLELTTGVSWAVAIDAGADYAGTVSGMMNTFGNLGGMLSPLVFGALVQLTGRWEPPFVVAGAACLVAAACWLRIDPARSVLRA